MAKRAAAAKDGVNVTREVLAIVEANQAIRGPEVLTVIKEKFPNITFNTNSVQVAFANARRKLGLTRVLARRPRKKALLARRPRVPVTAPAAPTVTPSATAPAADMMASLQAARDLLKASGGDLSVAREALGLVASLQMG
ncbi:MAG: hypothetical protein ACKO2P_14030 [Planctomycetota bacterium]